MSEEIGLSPSACLRRVARLKNEGAIRGIVALIDQSYINRQLTAVVTVKLERHGPEYWKDLITAIQSENAITQCYGVSGDVSCVLTMHVKDMAEYTEIADRIFHANKNIAAFTTHFVMRTIKEN